MMHLNYINNVIHIQMLLGKIKYLKCFNEIQLFNCVVY